MLGLGFEPSEVGPMPSPFLSLERKSLAQHEYTTIACYSSRLAKPPSILGHFMVPTHLSARFITGIWVASKTLAARACPGCPRKWGSVEKGLSTTQRCSVPGHLCQGAVTFGVLSQTSSSLLNCPEKTCATAVLAHVPQQGFWLALCFCILTYWPTVQGHSW